MGWGYIAGLFLHRDPFLLAIRYLPFFFLCHLFYQLVFSKLTFPSFSFPFGLNLGLACWIGLLIGCNMGGEEGFWFTSSRT